MAEITLRIPTTVDARFLRARCGVRYWDDAAVNGVQDLDGDLIPCREGDFWAPLIDLDLGQIVGWPAGTTAKVHFKVCDAGLYALLDGDQKEILTIDGYVPNILAPGGEGFGDYVIMDIGSDGVIANWVIDLTCFEEA